MRKTSCHTVGKICQYTNSLASFLVVGFSSRLGCGSILFLLNFLEELLVECERVAGVSLDKLLKKEILGGILE